MNREQLKEKYTQLTRSPWSTALLLTLSALGLGLLSLCFAMTENRWAMLQTYFQHPLILLLNLLPPVLLCLLLWLLTNRALIAYSATAVLVFGLTLANWYKLSFRDDPLLFGDLLLVKEAGNMLGRYSLFMTKFLAAALACILLGGLAVFFCARGRLGSPKWLRFALAGGLLLLTIPLSLLYTSDDVYNNKTNNPKLVRRWSTTSNFISKGFVYPFLHSVGTAIEKAPAGYHKQTVQALLSQYEDGAIPQEQQADVFGIMLEAFNDFSKYEEIPFTQDPYAAYHALEKESLSGNLITNIFAAGTVNTERAFLTGCADLSAFRSKTNSYAWYMKSQGYQTAGSHPCHDWFYNRLNINPNLGLDNYQFFQNCYGALADDQGNIPRDNVLFPEMLRQYEEAVAQNPAPYFNFSVTYQGHGPYHTDENDWGESYVEPGRFTPETENILNNYFGSVKSTGDELAAFVDSLRSQDRPVVLVVFGDHNPWMGESNSGYQELGLNLDLGEKEGFFNYYGTRYLIWANDAAKKALGGDFTGEGPDISPCFLMNVLFDQCGWEGPAYMQYTRQLMAALPVIREGGVSCVTAAGEYVVQPEGETAEKILEFRQVEYYMRHNFQYKELADSEQ